MSGKLTLIPTSIEELGSIKQSTFEMLLQASQNLAHSIIVVEDPKPARRRWLHWGLPRETIEHFVYLNEHGQVELTPTLISELKNGKNVFLMSDGGVPAFCDPGRALVLACHQNNIKVRCFDLENSLLSAVAVSGLTEGAFEFLGFPPKESSTREQFFKSALAHKEKVYAFMDTPYRLDRCLAELAQCGHSDVTMTLSVDIGRGTEEIFYGNITDLSQKSFGKREFVCIFTRQKF